MQNIPQDFKQGNIVSPVSVKDFPYDERLSSWEMSQLWLLYQANSQLKCVFQYFVAKAQDPEIKAVLSDALNKATNQLNSLISIFNETGFPLPHGFTEDYDVDPNAERLYSDSFMLVYLRKYNKFGIINLAHALPLATRPDVRAYLNNGLIDAQNLLNITEDLLAKKGLALRPPYTPVPDRANYVADKTWYGGLFGKKRPINTLELTHVYERLETKYAENAILLGFTQVAKDTLVKEYFSKGKDVLDKEINKWTAILTDEDLPLPPSWTTDVTDSTESPFSDKLMLFHIIFNITYSITANGFALGNCNRTDLVTAFSKAVTSLQAYGKEGLDLMIEKGWFEEIPLAADREKVIRLSH